MTEQASSLVAALLELQASLPTVAKRQVANTGSYSYKYAGLPSIMSALLPRLNRLGIVFVARPVVVDGRAVLSCELIHVPSGERMVSEFPLGVGGGVQAQAIGSAISYGRRYCLTAMVGLVAEDDDDGRAASFSTESPVKNSTESRPSSRPRRERSEPEPDEGPRMISSGQTTKLHALLTSSGNKTRDDKIAYCSSAVGRALTSTGELTLREAAMIISGLENAAAEPHTEDPGDPA